MKDVIQKYMYILLPLLSIILAVFILPPFVLFKLVYSLLKKNYLIEDVAGKVVIITGASSGLGEVFNDYIIHAYILGRKQGHGARVRVRSARYVNSINIIIWGHMCGGHQEINPKIHICFILNVIKPF